MTSPLDQAGSVSLVVATISAALTVSAFWLAVDAIHRHAPAAVVDAWRSLTLFALWSVVVFVSSWLNFRLFIDDFEGRGLRPEALWGGAVAVVLAYCWRRIHERRHAAPSSRGHVR